VLAAELVNAKADVIVTYADSGAEVVRRATSTIPIVAVDMTDPVGRGLAASLGRPGGNVTGVAWTSMGTQLLVKPLQFLRDLRPRLSRAAALHRASPAFVSIDAEARESARSIGIALECIEVAALSELDTAFAAVKKAHAEALLFWPSGDHTLWHATVAKRALDERLPSASQNLWYVRIGGLLGYGPPPGETWRRAADHIDKILRGANPGELPIDQPRRIDLVVNRRTAAALGVVIPQSLLLRANEVIE
jgi:putative ABC transport system substrate-binding protein